MRKEKVKVAIWGFGAMGSGMARMILNKQGFDIVGVCDRNPQYINKSVFEILSISNPLTHDVIVRPNIDEVVKRGECDVVLLATDSFTQNAYPKIKWVLEQGINVISTAEEMAFPQANSPELAKSLDEIAKANKATVLGTGINPGLMMDLLVIILTGACENIQSIEVSRINSLSPYGATVMEEQGVGLTLEEFNERKAQGKLAGHVGFKESIHMMAKAFGWKLDDFVQQMEPIITEVDRKSLYGLAEAGNVAGVNMTAQGYIDGKARIFMNHPQQIEPHLSNVTTGDYIKINGSPPINMAITPEVEGGVGTIAICVNMIPHVINAKPGLKTMIDLPVPRVIMGDVREMIEDKEE